MSWLNNLIVKIKGDKTHLDSTLKQSEGSILSWAGKVKGLFMTAFAAAASAVGLLVAAFKSVEAGADKLDFAIAAVKGGLQGLYRTIVTGDWGGLIDNITKTAKAMRDLKIAQDELEDISASNVVKKSYLERSLQAARTAAAGATDPKLKAQFLQEAIDAQKAITDIEVGEIGKRLQAQEQAYKTLSGFDEEAAILMIANFRKIAGNYETFFGEAGQYQMLLVEKQSLAYKDQLGILSNVEKAHYRQVQALTTNLELFQEFRNNLKPGEFNEYIRTIGDYNNTLARGDQELIRLTQSLTTASVKADKLNDSFKEIPRIDPLKKAPLPQSIELPGIIRPSYLTDGINQMRDESIIALQNFNQDLTRLFQDGVMIIADSIEDMFSAMTSGDWSSFGNKLLVGFANFLSMFGKLLVAYAVSLEAFQSTMGNIFSWPVALAAGTGAIAIAGLIKGAASKGGNIVNRGSSSGGGYGSGQANNMQVKVIIEGKTSGKDIYWSNKRYETELNSNT